MKRNYTVEKVEDPIMSLSPDYGVIWFKEDGKIFAHKLTEGESLMSFKRLCELADQGSILLPEYEELS